MSKPLDLKAIGFPVSPDCSARRHGTYHAIRIGCICPATKERVRRQWNVNRDIDYLDVMVAVKYGGGPYRRRVRVPAVYILTARKLSARRIAEWLRTTERTIQRDRTYIRQHQAWFNRFRERYEID